MARNKGKTSAKLGRPLRYDRPMERITFRAPPDLQEKLDAAASAAGKTRSEWIVAALQDAIARNG